MRRASIIKFIKSPSAKRGFASALVFLSLGFSSGLPAAAQPKKEPLPASIEAAKASPYVKTSLDPKPAAASTTKKDDKSTASPPLPKIVNRDKKPLPAPPAADAAPSPALGADQGGGISTLVKGPQNKGKYIKIPAANVDLTPPPPPPAPEKVSANPLSQKQEAPNQNTQTPPSDQARKAEADSVINDLEDLAAAPPPPPQRDPKTGNVMLPNKSRTVVVEQGSVMLDSSALKTIIEAQNRDDLVAYGNTMGKSLSENLGLLSQFYPFTLTVGGSAATPVAASAKPAEETLPPSDEKKAAKKSKKPRSGKKG